MRVPIESGARQAVVARAMEEHTVAGIQDFIASATQKLGISSGAASAGAGGLLGLIKQHAGAADFGKLATAIPGAADLGTAGTGGAGGGGGLGGMLGGLASKAGGLLGGGAGSAAGALTSLAGAGLTGDKAAGFLKLFVGFLKDKLPGDLLKTIAAKVPGLSGLLG